MGFSDRSLIYRLAFAAPVQGYVVAQDQRTLNDESLIQFADGANKLGVALVYGSWEKPPIVINPCMMSKRRSWAEARD